MIPQLPKPFGPHKVGSTEWEIPISEIPSASVAPDDKITTIKFRLFYPTTPKAKSRTSVPWLPSPQREWCQAYASFLGAGPRVSSILSVVPTLLNMTTIPCVADAPLLPREATSKYPLVIFSHGLGGNFNAYSAVCTALASFGIVCAAPEHRDGSAPISVIRAADGRKSTTIPYQRHPHAPTAKVLNARNGQLRIRLWELQQLFTVLTGLNGGQTFSNYANAGTKTESRPSLKNVLDLRPGHVTWAGHSFGACTTIQFVKSVYYHQLLPSWENTEFENDLDWRPLLKPVEDSDLVRQVTSESPVILLDLWAMPLRAGLTRWLWDKPLPCYDRKIREGDPDPSTNVIAIISAEFYKWPELINRMKAALSARPAEAMYTLEKRNTVIRTMSQIRSKSKSRPKPIPEKTLPWDIEESDYGTPRMGMDEARGRDQESDAGDEIFLTPFATPGEEFPFDKIMMNRRSGFEEWRDWSDRGEDSEDTARTSQPELETESMKEAVQQIRQMKLDLETPRQSIDSSDDDYMYTALEQPLPDSDDEDDRFGEAQIRIEVIADEAESDPSPTSRSSTSSNLTTSTGSTDFFSDSASYLSTPASSVDVSRTTSPSPSSASTCQSTSDVSTTASTLASPIEDLSTFLPTTKSDTITSTTLSAEPLEMEDPFRPSFSHFDLPPLDLPKLVLLPSTNSPSPLDPHLYHVPNTAHLSQSDFGVLFPKIIRYLMSAENPVETIHLNVRAILGVMRNSGLEVEALPENKPSGRRKRSRNKKRSTDILDDLDADFDLVDDILTDRCKEARWERLDLY